MKLTSMHDVTISFSYFDPLPENEDAVAGCIRLWANKTPINTISYWATKAEITQIRDHLNNLLKNAPS